MYEREFSIISICTKRGPYLNFQAQPSPAFTSSSCLNVMCDASSLVQLLHDCCFEKCTLNLPDTVQIIGLDDFHRVH